MIVLNNIFIQITIIVVVVIVFLGSFIINRKVKPPKDTKLPEKCQSCNLNSCIIKNKDVDKIKEELKEYISECEKDEKN